MQLSLVVLLLVPIMATIQSNAKIWDHGPPPTVDTIIWSFQITTNRIWVRMGFSSLEPLMRGDFYMNLGRVW